MSFIGTAPSLITFHQIQNTAAPGCCWHWPPTCGCQEVQDPGCGWCWHFPSGLWDVFQVDHCPTFGTWSKLGFGSPMTKLEIWHMMKNRGSKNDFWFHRLSYADTTCIALLQDTHHFTVLLLIWLLALELALNIGQNSRVYQHFSIIFHHVHHQNRAVWVVHSWI